MKCFTSDKEDGFNVQMFKKVLKISKYGCNILMTVVRGGPQHFVHFEVFSRGSWENRSSLINSPRRMRSLWQSLQ